MWQGVPEKSDGVASAVTMLRAVYPDEEPAWVRRFRPTPGQLPVFRGSGIYNYVCADCDLLLAANITTAREMAYKNPDVREAERHPGLAERGALITCQRCHCINSAGP